MARWCFRVVMFLLVVICGVIITAWEASYWREERLLVSRGGRCFQAISNGGRVRVFLLYDYPTPLPWIWEHDDQGRPPGRQIVRPEFWWGEGGTMEFFPTMRHERTYGPMKIADGDADTDPHAKPVVARRLAGAPQFISPREKSRMPLAPPPVADAEIDRLIKRAGATDAPVKFSLTPALPGKLEQRSGGVLDGVGADGFTLSRAIQPNVEAGRGGGMISGANFGSAGAGGGSGGAMPSLSFSVYPRYTYDEVGAPYWFLLLVPLSPLLLWWMVSLRQRRMWRNRR
jgi:hypothetical protein